MISVNTRLRVRLANSTVWAEQVAHPPKKLGESVCRATEGLYRLELYILELLTFVFRCLSVIRLRYLIKSDWQSLICYCVDSAWEILKMSCSTDTRILVSSDNASPEWISLLTLRCHLSYSPFGIKKHTHFFGRAQQIWSAVAPKMQIRPKGSLVTFTPQKHSICMFYFMFNCLDSFVAEL